MRCKSSLGLEDLLSESEGRECLFAGARPSIITRSLKGRQEGSLPRLERVYFQNENSPTTDPLFRKEKQNQEKEFDID